MRFIVTIFTYILLLRKFNYVATNSCVTLRDTIGNCTRREHCDLTFNPVIFNESVCGYDVDGANFYCCETTLYRPVANFRGAVEEEEQISPILMQNLTPDTSPISPSPVPDHTAENINTQTEKEDLCLTPNGEQARCIPIFKCLSFTKILALKQFNPNQVRFLRESKCGSNLTTPLVCCGPEVNYKSVVEDAVTNFTPNNLIPEECGLQLASRIFGGVDSESSEFPWLALLEFEELDGSKNFLCTGALISSRYVLTAAHCVAGRNVLQGTKLINIRLGEWDIKSADKNCTGTDDLKICNPMKINVGIESIHVHPNYNVTERYNDISLIKLNTTIIYNDLISPICLPKKDSYIFPGERLTVSGWGLKSYSELATTKQKVELPVVATSECSIAFQKVMKIKKQFCAGGESGKDACAGDSGAPLMKLSTEKIPRWSIEGIVSFGIGCGLSGRYGVYTKVSEYLEWIHNTVK